MGNILCLPRRPKNGSGKKRKGWRRWFFRKNKTHTDPDMGQDASTSSEQSTRDMPTKHDEEQTESSFAQTCVSKPNLFHVDPVVSSSILLKHFDDDSYLDEGKKAKETEDHTRTTDKDGEVDDKNEGDDVAQPVVPGTGDVETGCDEEKHSPADNEEKSEAQTEEPTSNDVKATYNEDKSEAQYGEPSCYDVKSTSNEEKPKAEPVEPSSNDVIATYKEKKPKAEHLESSSNDANATSSEEKPKAEPEEPSSNDAKATSNEYKPETHHVGPSLKDVKATTNERKPEAQPVELGFKDAKATSNEEKQEAQPVEKSSKYVKANKEMLKPTEEKSAPEFAEPQECDTHKKQADAANTYLSQPSVLSTHEDVFIKNDLPASEKRASVFRDVKTKLIVVKPASPNVMKDTSTAPSRKQTDDTTAISVNINSGETKRNDNTVPYLHIKATSSCPAVPQKSKAASEGMKELAKILEALSALKAPLRIDSRTSSRSNAGFSRTVPSTQAGTSVSARVTNTQQSGQTGGISGGTSPQAWIPAAGTRIHNATEQIGWDRNTVSPQPGTSRDPGVVYKSQLSKEMHNNVPSSQADKPSPKELATRQTPKDLVNTLVLSHSDNTDGYKSADGIQKWLKNSVSEPLPKVAYDGQMSNDKSVIRKVSDFQIPKKKPRPPPKPLVLKKPRPHLFGLPGIAKSDLTEDDSVTWSQKDLKGPQTEVLWSSKPTSYDVKFPPLPKRLLEREGSIDKLRGSWVIPQVRQIETLKREYGRFPGLRVPKKLRINYSVEVQKSYIDNGDDDGDDNDDDDDLN